MVVKAMPDGSHLVTPYLVVPEVATLLDVLTQAFEAHERHRLPQPDGTIVHAALRIGDARVRLATVARVSVDTSTSSATGEKKLFR